MAKSYKQQKQGNESLLNPSMNLKQLERNNHNNANNHNNEQMSNALDNQLLMSVSYRDVTEQRGSMAAYRFQKQQEHNQSTFTNQNDDNRINMSFSASIRGSMVPQVFTHDTNTSQRTGAGSMHHTLKSFAHPKQGMYVFVQQ